MRGERVVRPKVLPPIPKTKAVPGTKFCVDGLGFDGAEKFFVTHAHSDHYSGISDSFDRAPIYCGLVTANVLLAKFPGLVKTGVIHPLPMREQVEIDDGVSVTLVDANHCPGAVQFIFELRNGNRYIHSGDMRYHSSFKDDALLRKCREGVTTLYLDTTYCNPKYVFPTQQESIDYVTKAILAELKGSELSENENNDDKKGDDDSDGDSDDAGDAERSQGPQGSRKPLFLISTYSIGKEKILKAVAERCKCKIFVDSRKMKILSSIGDAELNAILTTNMAEAPNVHVVSWGKFATTWPYFQPNFDALEEYRIQAGADTIAGFVPTGWMYEMKKQKFRMQSKGKAKIHLVPYSEHSNFNELKEYVEFLRPEHVIPTVNGDGAGTGKKSAKMTNYFKHLMDETAAKKKFISSLSQKSPSDLQGIHISPIKPHQAAATEEGKGKQQQTEAAPTLSEQEKALLAIIPDVSTFTARGLLARAKGDLEVAVNLHFSNLDMKFNSSSKLNVKRVSETTFESREKRQKRQKKEITTNNKIKSYFESSSSTRPSEAAAKCGNIISSSQERSPIQITAVAQHPEMGTAASNGCKAERVSQACGAAAHVSTNNADANIGKNVKDYSPAEDGGSAWMIGQECPYLYVSETLSYIESTTKRLKISDALTNMFRSIMLKSPKDLLPALYLTIGKLAPDYMNVELGIGGRTVSNAIKEATGVTRARMSELYKKTGDLGDIAQLCKHNQRTLMPTKPLLVSRVYETLLQISQEKGMGSANRKKSLILKLLRSCRGCETKYLVRTLVQNLRVGASLLSILTALGRAAAFHFYTSPSKEQEQHCSESVRKTYAVCPNLEKIASALLKEEEKGGGGGGGGLDEMIRTCCLSPGVPVKPMLAKTANGVEDAVKLLQKALEKEKDDDTRFIAEHKYDGIRAQIHVLESGSVKVFSRNCEDRTEAFPDVVEIIKSALLGSTSSVILDAEIVAIDLASGDIRSFQDLSTRGRRDVDLHDTKINVCVFVFDMIFLNGEPMIEAPLQQRLSTMENSAIKFEDRRIESAKRVHLDAGAASEQIMRNSLQRAWDGRCEGLMLKSLSSKYEPDSRSDHWLKLKRDYCEDIQDSLDLVPIGAWFGNGRKAGWYSPILLAAWNPEAEAWESVCRCLSGFTDEFYKALKAKYSSEKDSLLPSKPHYYSTGESPSVWFKPTEVWEIRGADYTISPVHHAGAGLVDAQKGISVRFPRFVRCRPDKEVEEATTNEQLADMYLQQNRKR